VLGVSHPLEDLAVDEVVQPLGKDVAGDAEPGLEVVEPGHAEEGVPDDEQAPPLPHDIEALGDRAGHVLKAGPLHEHKHRGLHNRTHYPRLSFMKEPGTPTAETAKSVVAPPVGAVSSGGASLAGESGESGSPTARRRDVTWEDPLVGAALARDLSGLDYLLGIAEGRIPPAPIAALLGMSIVQVEPGQVTFGLDVGEHLYNPIGSVHGGVFCTLLDSAMGCAVHSSLDRGQAYTTLELKVNIVKALTLNTPSVAATGQVISGGRRVVTASGQITGPDGTLYAHAATTCLVFEPRPAQEQPAQEEEPSGRSAENGHGR